MRVVRQMLNLCGIVLMSLLAHMLLGKPMDKLDFEEADCIEYYNNYK